MCQTARAYLGEPMLKVSWRFDNSHSRVAKEWQALHDPMVIALSSFEEPHNHNPVFMIWAFSIHSVMLFSDITEG